MAVPPCCTPKARSTRSDDGGADVTGDYAIGVDIVRRALAEPAQLIAGNAGYAAAEVVAATALLGPDEGFDALSGVTAT